jgi:uncharacterized protein
MTIADTGPTTFERDWAAWRGQHEASLAAEHGFLAVTSLNWLSGEPQRFPDAPGRWRSGAEGVTVDLDPGEELVIDGEPVRGHYSFGRIPERGGVGAVAGDALIEVARRGGSDIVRPRHPGHRLRTGFTGVPVYPPDPRWVIPARYTAFAEPRPVTVGSVVEGLQHVYAAPGYVEFEAARQSLRLTAFDASAPGSLTLLFTDATSGVTTYAACRSLQTAAPAADGTVMLDFNRAVNLPCAFTPFATCPLAPAENRLPVAVEAGEQAP